MPKKMGAKEKDFGGRCGSPGFYKVFVSTTGLESFFLRPEKLSKRRSFGGGSVSFFFSECPVVILVRWDPLGLPYARLPLRAFVSSGHNLEGAIPAFSSSFNALALYQNDLQSLSGT